MDDALHPQLITANETRSPSLAGLQVKNKTQQELSSIEESFVAWKRTAFVSASSLLTAKLKISVQFSSRHSFVRLSLGWARRSQAVRL